MGTIIPFKTVIGMDIGKRYSWCEAISTETGEVLKEGKIPNNKEEFIDFVDFNHLCSSWGTMKTI